MLRTFSTGANRDNDQGKPDFEGYLSPTVLRRFGAYMLKHQRQADGSMRDSDNWQKGIPLDAYMKSMWRHFLDVWESHRKGDVDEEALCALLFNVQGMLHEKLKSNVSSRKPTTNAVPPTSGEVSQERVRAPHHPAR